MSPPRRLRPPRVLRRWIRRAAARMRGHRQFPVIYDPRYRLPITSLGARHGIEVRRADFAVWYLTIAGFVRSSSVIAPTPVSYQDIARIHTEGLLQRLTDGDELARVFQADPGEVRVESVMLAVRLACGGTLDGARLALQQRGPVLNLLGGFHHASPDAAAGLCPLNDVAIAVATLRAHGVTGSICILDLDAHPPDGTAACLVEQPDVWIGSLSGSDWGSVPGVDETVLPAGCDDETYLKALRALLSRMPEPALCFVLAGGDVLDGDRMGLLGLSVEGARRRDQAVHQALGSLPAVWMPAGGYSRRSWRVLAGTALVLGGYGLAPIPEDVAPEELRYDRIARGLDRERLGEAEDDWLDVAELEAELGMRRAPVRLLGTYTPEGVRYALDAYGILGQLDGLGYHDIRIAIDRVTVGERLRIFGEDGQGAEALLMEGVVERKEALERPILFIHWLTLRHPRAMFGAGRKRLPGQDVPGLGLSLEAVELLERAAARIGAEGLGIVPSFVHTAWLPAPGTHFCEPDRHGVYLALLRDLGGMGRASLSRAVAAGRVHVDGQPYTWDPREMVHWLDGQDRVDAEAVAAARDAVRFTLPRGT